MPGFISLILAAGKGTRMKSALPKVLHKVCGKPMLAHIIVSAREAGSIRDIAVVGFGAEQVLEAVGPAVEFVVQAEQLGTGHAVMQAREALEGYAGTVMVLCGDTPLLSAGLLSQLYSSHREARAAATVLTARMPDPTGYGRVIRDSGGRVTKIVEHKDARSDELAVKEINTGIYCFECRNLLDALSGLTRDNKQGEYYLTDVIAILAGQGEKVWAVAAGDHRETMGINSRVQLAEAEKILRLRKLDELMDGGVTIMDPDSTFIDAGVEIAADTVIYPFTWLEGATKIGTCCEIGPNTRLADTTVGDNTTLHFTYAHECRVGSGVTVGPYVHLRPDTVLADGAKVGNFVEIKNSVIGAGSKVPHLSYIGDTDMGAGVNIGSGTITVNYDGRSKHRTVIEDKAFIGCNANLVAPVTVGRGAYVGAGSTITKDVPPEALGVARSRQTNYQGWAGKHKG